MVMKINRIICVILSITVICLTAACGPGESSSAGGVGGGSSESSGDKPESTASGGNPSDGNAGEDSGSAGNNENGGSNGNAEIDTGEDNAEPGSDSTGSDLTGAPEDILGKLMDDLKAGEVEMPMCIPPMKVDPEMSQNTIGLSEADFEKYVADCAYTMAAIGTFAHQMIVIQAKDAGAAGDVKKIVSGDNGYDAKKWICVFPEKAVAVESGVYVLIVAASAEVADSAVEAFKDAAGSIGEVNTFWEFSGDGGEGGAVGAPGGLTLG